mgnify:CR=1 FL=1
MAIVFNNAVGNTIDVNINMNAPSNPIIKNAEARNIVPEIIVPIAVSTALLIIERFFLTNRNNP